MARPIPDGHALLLVNPRARRAAAAQAPEVLRALSARFPVVVDVPGSASALVAAVRRASEAGAAAVVVAGGDGTTRLATTALAGGNTPLGLLPAGTANDAARALGVPRNLVAAAAHLAAVEPRRIDLVDGGGGGAATAFLTVGGLGVVTAAALRAAALREGGPAARAMSGLARAGVYRLAAAMALCTPAARVRRYAVSYVTPAGVRRDEVVAAHGAFVANLPYCGGGLRVPGTGPPDDGAFELCFVAPTARPVLATRFARLAAGLAVPTGAVHVLPAREAHVACDASDALLGDGERLAEGRVFHLRSRPRALCVLA